MPLGATGSRFACMRYDLKFHWKLLCSLSFCVFFRVLFLLQKYKPLGEEENFYKDKWPFILCFIVVVINCVMHERPIDVKSFLDQKSVKS